MLKTISITLLAVAMAFAAATADAKKFGGGKSIGAQRSAVTERPASPSAAPSSAPASAAAAAPAAGAATATAAKPSLMSRMAGPLAGIAAGIGLGYLFSKMGAGGFMGILLIVGLIILAVIVFGRMMMKKPLTANGAGISPGSAPPMEPMQYAGGSASGAATAAAPVMASGLAGGFGIPAGFDKPGFEDNAKKQFMTLQSANDKGDLDAVRNFATDDFYNQIAKEVVSGNKEATQVDELHAELLGIETERDQHWASVEFTGKMREDGMVMASPFREVWNLIKPVDGSKGWLLAGIQQA